MKKNPAGAAAKSSTTQNTSSEQATNRTAGKSKQDLTDSPEDEAKMQEEETTLDLPEVKDIPGQEHIRVPRMGAYADTTPSSDDEEGRTVLDNPIDEDIVADRDSNVTAEEAALLRDAADANSSEEDEIIRATALDSTDEDGDPLNEKGFENGFSGDDLDVPGSEDDDANEEIGEEDEENNAYSVDEENEDDK